ncbi:MAG: saccharopine dehydrogenase C-terminal domain-containing protein [Candidatus Omnitrophota bacterium]
MQFKGKILVIGCGSVSQCAIPLVLKLIDAPPKNVTIMDFADNRSRVKDSLDKGVSYVTDRVTIENYDALLKKYIGPGDLIIDLAWNIDCIALLQWCRDNRILYVNTSVEVWDPYAMDVSDPRNLTLYVRQMEIRKLIKKWGDNSGPTAVVDHGANPGLVSHFTKIALEDIANKIVEEGLKPSSTKPKDKRVKILKESLDNKNYPELAKTAGVKVIHISERDTQITDKPKDVDEFVNTWSIEGFFEEGIAPAEMGWGTHEKNIPEGACFHKQGPKNQICIESMGVNTWVRSWVPDCEIVGMVIRHGEAFGISDRLTVWDKNGGAVYRPTVHYAYCPCDSAINSLHELEMRRYNLQKNQRIMNDEIIKGEDRLGVLLMGHDFNSWWTGSLLDIEETRKLAPGQNATTLQVAISVVAAAKWMIENPNKGFNLPDDIPHEDIMKTSRPYLGPFISKPVDWTPLKNYNKTFRTLGIKKPKEKDMWQFTTFLVS